MCWAVIDVEVGLGLGIDLRSRSDLDFSGRLVFSGVLVLGVVTVESLGVSGLCPSD